MTDFIGQTIGQYRIEAPLGSGGMGQVYRGVHKLLNRPAAIKVIQAHLAADPDFRSRFLREAQSAAALKHPNIVEIYDFGEQDGILYLVMELMTDGSVRTLLGHNVGQPLPLSLGLDLVGQAARGLAAAHAQRMVHRDIKPDNLLLNRSSELTQGGEQYALKISDFGLARLAEAVGQTTTGVPMGTLAYMSPEQCQSKPLDGRSDLYSLGVVLYEVATGYRPFQIDNFADALNKHVNVAPRSPREVRPDLTPMLETIILRCLAKKPEERYATGTELAFALQQVLSNLGLGGMAYAGLPTPTAGTVLQPDGGAPAPAVSTLPGTSAVPRVRVLDQSGQTLQVVEVKSQGLTIGRQSGNDIVLPSQAVSRQHVQVIWDGKQVIVKDLGSSNGTLLEGVRLLPQVSQMWMERQMIRVGPFWLRLEGASQAGGLPTQATQLRPSTFSASTTQRTPILSERIGIAVTPKTLTITPGQPATIQVMLTNLGNTVDWFTPTVEGVPPEWVQRPVETTQLNPGMQETVELSVNVARAPNNRAQDYPVTIRARSREKPNESGTAQARWTVLPFKEEAMSLEPRRASGRGKASYTVSLYNGGNTASLYQLGGEDDEQLLDYRFRYNPVDLDVGQEARVPLTVHGHRRFIGREERKPFQLRAGQVGNPPTQLVSGEFVNKALLPPWIVLAFLLIAGGVVGLISGLIPLSGQGGTATPTPDTGATLTSVVQNGANTATVSAISAQATATANANAQATATAQVNAPATATATARQDEYTMATSGTPVLDDPLSDNSRGYGWDAGSSECQFTGGALHAFKPLSGIRNCDAIGATNFSNFAFQVQMMIINGDAGGIDFRSGFRSGSGPGYFFIIGQGASYTFYRTANFSIQTVAHGSSSAIHSGVGQTNLITVVARNDTFDFFVNAQYVTSVTDSTYSQGFVGVDAYDVTRSTDVSFINARVWAL